MKNKQITLAELPVGKWAENKTYVYKTELISEYGCLFSRYSKKTLKYFHFMCELEEAKSMKVKPIKKPQIA